MRINKQSGVTLIELTVVLLILVALAGVVVPYIGGTSSAAMCKATDVTMENVKKAIMERYYLDTLGYFPKKTKDGDNDYNLKYLFEHPETAANNGWDDFSSETQLGWRPQNGYLQGGVMLTLNTKPSTSFQDDITTDGTPAYVHEQVTENQIQVLDGWGRPIIIQAYCHNPAYGTKTDCESHKQLWVARLISAGQYSSLSTNQVEIDTPVGGDRPQDSDDRILYLNTPATVINDSCDK